MKTLERKSYVVIILLTILAVSVLGVPKAYSKELTPQEKGFTTIKDIIGIDTTKYNVELSSYNSRRPENYGGLIQEDMTYTLKDAGSEVRIIFRFLNETLVSFKLYSYNSSLLTAEYAKPLPANTIEATKIILQRFQSFNSISYIQPMYDSMVAVTNADSVNATIGNVKRQIIVNTELILRNATSNYTSTTTSISIEHTINGADSPKIVKFNFKDDVLESFSNNWNFFTIGSETINIQREKAIQIARELANNASTGQLNYADRPVTADLQMKPREPFVLYPFWFIELPLDYPKSTVIAWQAGIWADTGEIAFSHPVAVLGSPPNIDDPTSTFSPPLDSTERTSDIQNTQNNQNKPLNNYFIAALAATIAMVVIATVVVLKKRAK